MNKNKIRYCTLLLIDGYNHSKIFISRKNKYYITNNKLTSVRILNKFKDIRKPYYTSVEEDVASIRKSYGISVIDITNNYYKNDKIRIKIRRCTILLIEMIIIVKYLILKKKFIILVIMVNIMVVIMIIIIIMIVMLMLMMLMIMMLILMILTIAIMMN